VNGGQDFDQELLDDIYNGIKWVLDGQIELQDCIVSILFSFYIQLPDQFIQHQLLSLNSSKHSGSWNTTCFNIENTQHFILTVYIYVVVTINRSYFTTQQQEGGLGSGDTVFCLRWEMKFFILFSWSTCFRELMFSPLHCCHLYHHPFHKTGSLNFHVPGRWLRKAWFFRVNLDLGFRVP
jgi:hypothetical protein